MKIKSLISSFVIAVALAPSVATAQSTRQVPTQAVVEAPKPAAVGVRNFMFVTNQASGWRQYTPRQVAMFKAGEALQFYAEPVNLGWTQRGQGWRFDVRVDIEIRSPEGKVVWGQKDFGKLNGESLTPDPETYVTGSVKIEGLTPGFYMMTLRFRDPTNNRVAETETAFGIMMAPIQIDA